MTKYCVSCGRPIPDKQRVCSVCYGDLDYGSDGYYREWAEEQFRQEQEGDYEREREEMEERR